MGKRILIVDDSTMMRKIIAKTLKTPGHQIIGEASNGTDALKLYKELNPDLVTMDITMRGMDGLTAAQEILNYDQQAQILFLSNLDEDRYRGKVERLGALGMVKKHRSNEILELIEGMDK